MRLINTSTLQLKEFFGKSPPYAILSHTWEDDEVSFQDMERGAASHRKGYAKIEWTCRLAEQRGLQWAWVDTCCIDKTSSSELSEAINSMFQWYKDAVVCYAFLGDLDSRLEWPQCKWFKRGWTLQELIAPRNVEFYDRDWTLRGTKRQLEDRIHEITRIDKAVLLNQDALGTVPVARRMSWAARRETTRVEDGAYCLLGIFEVNMPMLYGEGPNAFFRLQEEIMKASNDMSLFAWSRVAPSGRYRGILAHSPAEFRDCGAIDLADEDMATPEPSSLSTAHTAASSATAWCAAST
ncbi:HET-domain-containing protein [Thozetella sp. PMI_491]|nr:HET-domain-containing protein [Thozetella sp. PMI_491]